jgi:hypothetical protein
VSSMHRVRAALHASTRSREMASSPNEVYHHVST